jgi:hypothetical protein
MKTTISYLLITPLLLVVSQSGAASAKTTSLRERATQTATELQGLIDAIDQANTAMDKPIMKNYDGDKLNEITDLKGCHVTPHGDQHKYTDEELEIAEASAKSFLESKGLHLPHDDEMKHTEDELDNDDQVMEKKGMPTSRPKKYTELELAIAAESARIFIESKGPHSLETAQHEDHTEKDESDDVKEVPNLEMRSDEEMESAEMF